MNLRAKFLKGMPIDWLLSGEPFVQYRTLIDLLDKKENDKEVLAIKQLIPEHKLIKQIFARQNKDGYWGTPKDIYKWFPKKDTTLWLLGVLADLGFTKEDRRIANACEYVFSTQHASGGFGCGPPLMPYDCFTGILTESLAKLGYVNDSRLKKAYEWLTQRQRVDGGFWCKNTGQSGRPREKEPSCAFATLFVLGALIQNPKLKNSTITRKSADFLISCWKHRGKIKYAGHDSQVGKGWEKLKYPFTDYRILKYFDTLSQLEFIKNDNRIIQMINLLIAKRDENGRFYTESIHECWSGFDFGQKEFPSRWITMLVYRIVKRVSSF